MDVQFFPTQADLRQWFMENHDKVTELWVGYYKKNTGKPSITWPESVDEALCFGWIDGVRKSIDEDSYKIRFTPRKPRSTWSNVNIKRVGELIEAGLMQPTGLKTFEARTEDRSGIYSSEQGDIAFTSEQEQQFKANKQAWEFFQSQPPSYRKPAIWWVISAKKDETRLKRLNRLIDDSANGQRIKELTPPSKR